MTINCVGSLLRKGLAHYDRPPGQRQRDPGWRRRGPQIALYRGHGTQVRSNGRVQSRTGILLRTGWFGLCCAAALSTASRLHRFLTRYVSE